MGKRIVIDLSKPGLDEAVASRLELRSLPLGALIAPPSGGMATVAADLRVARARLALDQLRGLRSDDPDADDARARAVLRGQDPNNPNAKNEEEEK